MPLDEKFMIEEIARLKQERNAVVLVHNYQLPEVQAVADILGDSLGLAREASETDAELIILCGVRFMAETAALLCPNQRVLLPERLAGCPMADMITGAELAEARERFPDLYVITYVNSTADVKAESDICCTSSNAVRVMKQAPAGKQILFVPDQHLGEWAARQLGKSFALYPEQAEVMLWHGFCNVHHRLKGADVLRAKEQYPNALVMAHPECDTAVLELADKVTSTGGMLNWPGEAGSDEFVVATEVGMLEPLRQKYPQKRFYACSASKLVCWNMKLTGLESVYLALKNEQHLVTVAAEIADPARRAIERMLALG